MARDLHVAGTVVMLVLLMRVGSASCQLTASFYSQTCPNVESIVRSALAQALQKDSRIGASVLRLFFHDCFVQGCDASVLLDGTTSSPGEKTAFPNANSLRGFEVIDSIKAQVEAACKGVVSCADILALAARDGVVLAGGPTWTVLLGRRDSRTASLSGAISNLPGPAFTLEQLIANFQAQGLSVEDLVALSGGHTIGQARCINVRARLYNQSGSGQPDPTLNAALRTQLVSGCPRTGGDNNLFPMDVATPTTFDTAYFSNMLNQRSVLFSDQVLFSASGSNPARPFVASFTSSRSAFFAAFTSSMVKLGNINPLTGANGEIRTNCRVAN